MTGPALVPPREEKETILLPILAQQLPRKEIEKRAGAAFDLAYQNTLATLSRADELSRGFGRCIERGDLLSASRVLTDALQQGGYEFSLGEPTFGETVPKKVRDEYRALIKKELAAAKREAGGRPVTVVALERLQSVSSRAVSDGVEIHFNVTIANVDAQILQEARAQFVKACADIVESGLFGNEATVIRLTFHADRQILSTFVAEFNSLIGIERGMAFSGDKLFFDDARISEDKLPLTLSVEGSAISMSWPSWIYPGEEQRPTMKTRPRKS